MQGFPCFIGQHACYSVRADNTSLVKQAFTWNAALGLLNNGNHVIRDSHYQRGGFNFLNKHSLARNLSSLVDPHEKAGMRSQTCHSSLKHQVSSSYVVGSLTLSSVLITRSSKSIMSRSFAAETENVGGFLSAWYVMSQLHREHRSLTGSVSCSSCLMSDSSAAACWLAFSDVHSGLVTFCTARGER